MHTSVQEFIPVVTCNETANYPFAVQTQPTQNWVSQSAFVTLEAALAKAAELKLVYPSLPIRVEHCTGGPLVTGQLPVFKRREVATDMPYNVALWSGDCQPPKVGEKVHIRLNNIGPAVVTGYAVLEGYLGVMALAEDATRPQWHKDQNPQNHSMLAFGAELS